MTTLLVFGTSTVYGAWDSEGGWVQRLRRYLDEKQLANPELYYIVYNLGVSGDTSRDVLERFDSETKNRLEGSNDEIVIVLAIGSNDSIVNNKTNKTNIPIEDFSSNVEQLILKAKKYADKVIFVG